MPIPSFDQLLRPALDLAAAGDLTRASLTAEMAQQFRLTEAEREQRITSGARVIANRSGWAMTFLTKGGLIEKVAPKTYRATGLGREWLAEYKRTITVKDLEGIPGWEEAWKPGKESDVVGTEWEGAVDANPLAPAKAHVRAVVERVIPNPTTRQSVIDLLARAIENADEERHDSWCLRERTHGLRLLAGRLYACGFDRKSVHVSVIGPIPESVREALGAEEDHDAFKTIPGSLILSFPAERSNVAQPLLMGPLDRFIDEAMRRVRRRVTFEHHSDAALEYLEETLGRPLPRPEEPDESVKDEGDDEDEEVDTASREPRSRGRAPIFEHGQRSISSLVSDIEQKTLALPDLQRPFVWEDKQVRDLLDSLFVGFPVGTLVLWHTQDGKDARSLGGAPDALKANALVIDGQQRLTALNAVMRGEHVIDKDGERRRIQIAFRPRDGRFEVADAAIRHDPEFLDDVTDLWCSSRTKHQIGRDLIAALRDKGRPVDDTYENAVLENLDRARGIGDYRFPVVDIRKTAASEEVDEEDIAEIFVRINNQGRRLGQADFVLTLLSVFHGSLRDRIEKHAAEMSRDSVIEVGTQHLLRATCAVAFGRARMPAIYKYLRGVDPVTGDAKPVSRQRRLEELDSAASKCMDQSLWRDFMLRVLHAGIVSPELVSSNAAVVNAYAFYVLGRDRGVSKPAIDESISRWLFATLLVARYSLSSETTFEADLARVHEVSDRDAEGFLGALDGLLFDVLPENYWGTSLVSALETQRSRAPSARAFRAAQIVLGARALFSDQLLRDLLAPPSQSPRSPNEVHHLFPKAWLQSCGIRDRRSINQVANLADTGWFENSFIGSARPSQYVPRVREKLDIDDDAWGRACAEHALPLGWESMEYEQFLKERRLRMADVIRAAYRTLGGEENVSAVTPPWFTPGAEAVWTRIADAERALRNLVRSEYARVFGDGAASRIEASISERELEALKRALRSRPTSADPLSIVDYLYLGQLPSLLYVGDVWEGVRKKFGGTDAKQRVQQWIQDIAPVRNEIAHVREVAPTRLQKANVACEELLASLLH
jgi:hypothetical protein